MTQLLKDKYCFGHIISLLEYFATKQANYYNKIIDVQEAMEKFVFPDENRTIEEFDENK